MWMYECACVDVFIFWWPNHSPSFTQKQVFGPRTAKSQLIWIKFCTHLMLYRIHLWDNLDRDQRLGGSRPNQNDCFFCNTCNGKQSKWMWGRVLLWKIPEFCNVGRARSKILELSCTQPTGNSFTPNQWYRWKAKTLKVCLLLVYRVCDQAFGRERPWRVPKSGNVTITKIENLQTHVEKFSDSKNAILFDL